jgi:hypothetical protein
MTLKTAENLNRKLKDLYGTCLLPNKDTDISQSFNNSQILYRRADFNLFSINLELDLTKIKQIHYHEVEVASRPRRRSIDALANDEASSSLNLEGSCNFKQHVVANLQKTA